jgi:hypothetical protein
VVGVLPASSAIESGLTMAGIMPESIGVDEAGFPGTTEGVSCADGDCTVADG